MRLFVGFLLPEENKPAILKLQSEIEHLGADCKNVEKDNLHVSMSFLGETHSDDVGQLAKEIEKVALSTKKITVDINGTRAIPSRNFIRVIALSVNDNDGNLERLLEEIRQKIGGDVKPPHLTLCRVRSTRNKEKLLDFIEKYENKYFTSIQISKLQLIESRLGRNGPVYSVVSESELQA